MDEIDAVLKIKQFSGVHQTRLKWWLAYAGDGQGNVYTSQANYYLCRYPLASSPTVEIFNNRITMVDGLRIIVGYTAYQPNLLQVLDVADQRIDTQNTTDTPTNPGSGGYNPAVAAHSGNHQYLGADQVAINLRQWTPLGVYPSNPADLTVQVFPGTIPRPGVDVNVAYQTIDLSASVPVTGARYALISYDSTGAVVVTDGAINAGGFGALTNADVPATPAGNWRSAAVVLYAGQTAIVETTSEIDFLDLRFPEETLAGSITPDSITLTNTHIIIGNASNIGADVAMSNDATISNTGAVTLKNTGPGATGPLGSATTTPVITIDAQGRVTALTSTAITFPIGAVNVYNETQTANGTSTIYYLTNYAAPGTIRVYIDGIRQPASDDVAATDVVTFTTAPDLGALLMFDYEMETA